MNLKFFTCTAMSAFLGASAFLVSDIFWWLIFLFLIPLFVRVAQELPADPGKEGFFWGVIFFMIHSAWLFPLMQYKTGFPALGLVLAAFFIGYCALYGALWFVLAAWITRRHNTPAGRTIAWMSIGLMIFYWLERGAFWITGQWDGYPLVQPLLPLAVKQSLLLLLPLVGSYGLLALLFGFAGAVALLIVTRRWGYGLLAVCCLLPFGYSLFWWQPGIMPTWCTKIGYICPQCAANGVQDQAEAIANALSLYHKAHPAIETVLMPESSLSVALNDYPQFLSLWDTSLLHTAVTIILGAHQHQGNCWYNALYCIQQGNIVVTHIKTHCVPFVEYLPFPWTLFSPLYELFLGGCYSFSHCRHKRIAIPLLPTINVIPYICSELYFSYTKPDDDSAAPLLCIVNDSWFVAYVQRLLFLLGRCKAIGWQRDLIYVGHSFARYVSHAGNDQLLGSTRCQATVPIW
jgi:apolipoprotein N-acyltransferase